MINLAGQYTKLYTYKRRIFYTDLIGAGGQQSELQIFNLPRTVEINSIKVWNRQQIRGASIQQGVVSFTNNQILNSNASNLSAYGSFPLETPAGNNVGQLLNHSSAQNLLPLQCNALTVKFLNNTEYVLGLFAPEGLRTYNLRSPFNYFSLLSHCYAYSFNLNFVWDTTGSIPTTALLDFTLINLTTNQETILAENVNISQSAVLNRGVNFNTYVNSTMLISPNDVLVIKLTTKNFSANVQTDSFLSVTLNFLSLPVFNNFRNPVTDQSNFIDNMVEFYSVKCLTQITDGSNLNNLTQGYFDVWFTTVKRP